MDKKKPDLNLIAYSSVMLKLKRGEKLLPKKEDPTLNSRILWTFNLMKLRDLIKQN